jgi:hypothetical protein
LTQGESLEECQCVSGINMKSTLPENTKAEESFESSNLRFKKQDVYSFKLLFEKGIRKY